MTIEIALLAVYSFSIFCDEIDTVLGTMATSEPPILMDSGLLDGGGSLNDSQNGKFISM